MCSPEYKQNIQEYDKTAEKALQNIDLIYKEIMAPKYDSENLEIHYPYEDESISQSFTMQNHYVRTCCNSVKELCVKCDKFISGCPSCQQCKCCIAEKSTARNSYKERSEGSVPCTYGSSQHELKCTVPKPFSFYSKIEDYQTAKALKISKIKQDLERKIENEMKVRANSKPVPKSTYLPLFCQMTQEMEQRKVKRKEKCQEVLNNTKPFDLHQPLKNSMKSKSTTNLVSENTHFRAKPVPKQILSDKVSEKFKNKEEMRKLLIGERARQTIEKSSSPFSQKAVPCTRSCVDLSSLNKTQNKEKSKPKNISEITKRLYVKKCSVTMENWNKKVLQVNADQEKMQNSMNEYMPHSIKQLIKKDELPFMYFPVRMSNASLMREKQIR